MKRRSGFTLTELLVAIVIIVVLMGLVLAFMPRRESVATRDTAGRIESYLSGAKMRALRDQRPIGVRFLSNDGNQTFYALQLLDQGGDWMPTPSAGTFLELPSGATIQSGNQNANPNVVGNTARQFGVALQGNVEVGDLLEIHDTTPSQHRITAIDFTTNTMTLAASKTQTGATWFVNGIPNVSSVAGTRLPHNYRYIRRARPLVGEENFQFPKDVVIRGPVAVPPTSVNMAQGRSGDYEITFAPSGNPISANGRIVLWIADTNNVAKPILVAIYPTGAIKSHDVGPVGNEFSFTQDGR